MTFSFPPIFPPEVYVLNIVDIGIFNINIA